MVFQSTSQSDKRIRDLEARATSLETRATNTENRFGNYYTAAQVNSVLGGYYTAAQVNSRLGSYYTKAETESRISSSGGTSAYDFSKANNSIKQDSYSYGDWHRICTYKYTLPSNGYVYPFDIKNSSGGWEPYDSEAAGLSYLNSDNVTINGIHPPSLYRTATNGVLLKKGDVIHISWTWAGNNGSCSNSELHFVPAR